MVMISKKNILLAKSETTYGTDPTPGATDVIEAIDPQIKETFETVERPVKLKTLSSMASVAGAKFAEVTFKAEIKGSGSAGTAPRLGPLLLACRNASTVVSATSVTYAPTAETSITLWLYLDGRLHVVNGCYGTAKFLCEAGKTGMIEFSFKGLWVTPTVTALPSVTYETTVPPVCKGTVFSFNSKTTLVASKMEFDIGNSLVQRPSLSATNAIQGFEITDRKPVLSFDVEGQFETSYGFRADALTTPRAVSYVIGATAGNICTITIPKFNITSVEYSDKDGITIESLKGECSVNAAATGDDEFSVSFT